MNIYHLYMCLSNECHFCRTSSLGAEPVDFQSTGPAGQYTKSLNSTPDSHLVFDILSQLR